MEGATRLLRFPLAQTGEELIVPTDVEEDHWARECILRAVNGSKILEESLLELPQQLCCLAPGDPGLRLEDPVLLLLLLVPGDKECVQISKIKDTVGAA